MYLQSQPAHLLIRRFQPPPKKYAWSIVIIGCNVEQAYIPMSWRRDVSTWAVCDIAERQH
jgi:hypothetical protein